MVHLILFFLFHYGLLLDIEYSFLCYIVGPCLSILLKNIFDVDLFYVFVEFVALLFLAYVLVFGCEENGILAPWAEFKPMLPAVEGTVLTTGLPYLFYI